MQRKEKKSNLKPWILIFLMAILALSMLSTLPNQPIADELIHIPQIQSFMSGSMVLNGIVAMPPGFHLTVASIANILQIQTLTGLRAIHTILTLICPILFWIYLRLDGAQYPSIRSAQFLVSPIIWPFFFLLYTDLSALLLLLIGLILVKQDKVILAVVICTISLAFRQNNIFWIALLWLEAICNFYQSNHLFKSKNPLIAFETPNQLIPLIKRTTLFLIPLCAFGIFVYLNGGVAMGNKDLHQANGLYPTQVFFFLLVIWIILLPLHIYNFPAILALIFKYKIIFLGLATLAVMYKFSFDISHPYNFPSNYFIRNWMLYKLKDHPIWHALSFLPIAWALLSISVTKLKKPAYYWLYPITLISLLPVHLIEQRYYIVPLSLFLLFRLPVTKSWETSLLAWGILLSGAVTYGISSMKIFL